MKQEEVHTVTDPKSALILLRHSQPIPRTGAYLYMHTISNPSGGDPLWAMGWRKPEVQTLMSAAACIDDHLESLAAMPALEMLPVIRHQAWFFGRRGWTDILLQHWDELEPETRGDALAGLSECAADETLAEWVDARIESCVFGAEAACQLAVNGVGNERLDWVDPLLRHPDLLERSVDRVAAENRMNDGGFSQQVAGGALRNIDILLESCIRGYWGGIEFPAWRIDLLKRLLELGADPDVGMFDLGRSYSDQYCVLSYVIDRDLPVLASLLLERGANPDGTDYSGIGQPLFVACMKRRISIVEDLVKHGARFDVGNSLSQYLDHYVKETQLVRNLLGRVLPLIPVSEKVFFMDGGGMPGSYTHLTAFAGSEDSAEDLRRLLDLGLPAHLSAEEIGALMAWKCWNCLDLLLEWHGIGESARREVTRVVEMIKSGDYS